MRIYLWINALLYAAFALWCTFAPAATARAIGYTGLTAGGRSEYLVVYGGLELGLALMFAYLARSELVGAGLVFSLALYVPIVLYRAATLVREWPVAPTTLATAALELALLIAAIVLWRVQRISP